MLGKRHHVTKQITEHVLNCPVCLTHRQQNAKEPLLPHNVPDRPWQFIACDLFTLDNADYLVTVDMYSKYFEVDAMPDTKSLTVTRKLKVHFARYGIPKTLKTDNGPQFSSEILPNSRQNGTSNTIHLALSMLNQTVSQNRQCKRLNAF